jgi:hypothetical protein
VRGTRSWSSCRRGGQAQQHQSTDHNDGDDRSHERSVAGGGRLAIRTRCRCTGENYRLPSSNTTAGAVKAAMPWGEQCRPRAPSTPMPRPRRRPERYADRADCARCRSAAARSLIAGAVPSAVIFSGAMSRASTPRRPSGSRRGPAVTPATTYHGSPPRRRGLGRGPGGRPPRPSRGCAGQRVFVGIARDADVSRYLAGVRASFVRL